MGDEEKKVLESLSQANLPSKQRRKAKVRAEEVADLLAQGKKALLRPGEQEEMDAKKREAEATEKEIEQLREEEKMWQEKAVKKPKDAEPELERLAHEIVEMEAKLRQLEEEAKPKPRPPPKFHQCDVVPILQKLMSSRVSSEDAEMVQNELESNFKKYCPPCRRFYLLEEIWVMVSLLDRYVDRVHFDMDLQTQGAMTVTHAARPTSLSGSARLAEKYLQRQAYREACKLTLPEQPPPKSFLSRSMSDPGLRRNST